MTGPTTPTVQPFKLYDDGSLYIRDPRVENPICFAHVTDLHLPPYPQESWPEKYRPAIDWWYREMRQPDKALPALLDDIKTTGVDFIIFGGDTLDCYDYSMANRLLQMCHNHDLNAYFALGNHDWETEHIRYEHHEYNVPDLDKTPRKDLCEELIKLWNMPGPYYSFDRGDVRFVILDIPYGWVDKDLAGVLGSEQTDWLIDQLRFDGPIMLFHHVPFDCPTVSHRLREIWNGSYGRILEDDDGLRALGAIDACPKILGTFTGHAHMRSEDPIGKHWQFMTGAAYIGQWRLVKVARDVAPKSLRVEGEPRVAQAPHNI